MKNSNLSRAKIKEWLDDLLLEFNITEYLDTDPIGLVHEYHAERDRELVALIAALFSYGNVKSIRAALAHLLRPLGEHPSDVLAAMSSREIRSHYRDSYYRFYKSEDIIFLLLKLKKILSSNGSLSNLAMALMSGNTLEFICNLRDYFLMEAKDSYGIRFMFADPYAGCAKRWHMLLRWMSRKDQIDLGIWSFLPASQLFVPLDTHVFEISRRLQLTRRKTNGLKAVVEVTESLREFDAKDPLRYDFALCRLGVLGLKEKRLNQLLTASQQNLIG